MIFEDLLSGQTTQISSVVSETQLLFETPITLSPCGFYRVGFIGALAYFPDVFAWYVMNQDVGVGSYFPMPQFFIDWGAIAVTRRWVEARGYFYDRVIAEKITFQQWAEDEARNSRLLLVRVGGQFKLRIDEAPPIPNGLAFEFNASNTKNFQIEGIRQQERRINSTIVTFPDGRVDTTVGSYVIPPSFSHDGHRRDRPQSVTIETEARANRIEPTSEQTYIAESVTNEYQAVDVAALFMKRKRMRLQARFITNWAGINLQAGDWVSAHEKQYNGAETFAGYVAEIIEPYTDGCQTVAISDCFVKFRDSVTTSFPGVFALNGSPDIVAFLRVGELIQLSDRSTVTITAIDIASSEITFVPAQALNNEPVTFLKTDFSNDEALVYHYNLNTPGQEGVTEEATGIEAVVSGGIVYLKLCTDTALEVLDVITVGPTVMSDTIYRVTQTSPRDGNELEVICVEDSPENYTKAGLVLKYDDAAIAVVGS